MEHQSFCPLQHRCAKLLSSRVIAVMIGAVVALLVFGCSPSTTSIANAASPWSQILHGQAEAAVRGRLDGGFHSQRAGGKRMLVQLKEAVFDSIKGKHLRGMGEFHAELTKKKRGRKQIKGPVQNEAQVPTTEEDPQLILFENLSESFPLVGNFLHKHPFYFVYLFSLITDDTIIINFFNFCHEFPELAEMVHWAPPLLFDLVHLRGAIGHTEFSVLLICFLVFPALFILILSFGPRQFFHRFLTLMLRFQRKKRS